MAKEIPLTQGKLAIVDEADFEWISRWKWAYFKGNRSKEYAVRREYGRKNLIFMHKQILGIDAGTEGDHIDGNGLNNQRNNLREATHHQNCYNTKKRKNSLSKYKGVSWNVQNQKWLVRIMVNQKTIYLGYFLDENKAALKYNEAALKYFGNFAKLNQIQESAS